ncbi:MAG: type II toxin-antitoxin system VapC family toxin [Pseudomonadota bacterium]
MRGIDTNVLFRLVLVDDAEQMSRARLLLPNAELSDPLYINHIVLAEFIWVMTRHLKENRAIVDQMVRQLLDDPSFHVERGPLVRLALEDFKSSKADFADCLIGAVNRAAGCGTTYTFDRNASALETFTDVPPQ